MNKRGNGLSADSYDLLIDLAPHLADSLLRALGEAGVAAYVTSQGSPGPATPDAAGLVPRVEHRKGPEHEKDLLDRLYVDAAMKPTAEGILHAHLTRLRDAGARGDGDRAETPEHDAGTPDAPGGAPSGDPPQGGPSESQAGPSGPSGSAGDSGGGTGTAERDEDAIWAEIVASFDETPGDGEARPWPDEENLDEPPAENEDRTGRLRWARVIKSADDETDDAVAAKGDPDATEPADLDEDDEEGHFVPPPPPPLPSADPLTKAAWVALIGGPVYLLITVILNWDVPGWAAFLAVAAFIGGFVTLVLRMGDEPRGPDDGAVV